MRNQNQLRKRPKKRVFPNFDPVNFIGNQPKFVHTLVKYSRPENLTGFMLAPEVKQLANFGFLPNDRPIKTF